MAVKLQEKNIPFTILEQSPSLGGTWYENIYPGSGCDVPSFLYSFSFFPKKNWSKVWAKQEEILEYYRDLAAHFKLNSHIQLNTKVLTAKFDEKDNLWTVTTTKGDFKSNFLISGVGQLNIPSIPDLPGRELFEKPAFHSAKWDKNVKFEGKTVACVGNGASAIQILPEIAPLCKRLHVFQSTPSHITGKGDYAYSPVQKAIFQLPFVATAYRWLWYWRHEILWFFFKKGTNENKTFTKLVVKEMTEGSACIKDPEVRKKVIPSFAAGCKRVLRADDYFSTIARDNVTLIDERITGLDKDGLVTAKNKYPVDVILFCTGFKATEIVSSFEVQGTKSSLKERWEHGASAYMGMAVPTFPNFFILYGPNTNLGHNSITFMIECQTNYIVKVLHETVEKNHKKVEVNEAVFQKYQNNVEKTMEGLVWTAGCASWYTKNGQVVNNLPYSTVYYWWKTAFASLSDYVFK